MSLELHRGDIGAEVGNLQRFLVEVRSLDASNHAITVDEVFGPKTEFSLSSFQLTVGLWRTGKFDGATRRAAIALGFVPFLQARNCRILWPKRRTVKRIVIHTMECQEAPLAVAENVAAWFASLSAPVASAHYCVDRDSIVQCVRDTDEAWHASQGNTTGIGIEHAGYARQTADEWSDAVSVAILRRSAKLAARLCRTHGIPVERVSHADIVAGRPGFCGHADVNEAYGNHTGHTDPGVGFPWSSYLALVKENV